MNDVAYKALLTELSFTKDRMLCVIALDNDNVNYSICYQKEPFSLELELVNSKPLWWFNHKHNNLTSFWKASVIEDTIKKHFESYKDKLSKDLKDYSYES